MRLWISFLAALVALKYARPAISVPAEDFSQRERHFLLQCMAVASQPVEVE